MTESKVTKPAKQTELETELVSKLWAFTQKFPEESIEELVNRLNTAVEVPNPEPQRLLPEKVTFAEIRAVVPDIEAFKVLSTPIWPMAAEALERGDMQSVQFNIKALVAGQCLTEKTAGAIAKLFVGKTPDPQYKATIWISPAEQNNQIVTLEDLQEEMQKQIDQLTKDALKAIEKQLEAENKPVADNTSAQEQIKEPQGLNRIDEIF